MVRPEARGEVCRVARVSVECGMAYSLDYVPRGHSVLKARSRERVPTAPTKRTLSHDFDRRMLKSQIARARGRAS